MSWHVEPAVLAEYAEGRTGDVMSASIESHTDTCSRCRALIRPAEAPDVWDAIRIDVNAPRPGQLQRMAGRLMPESDALLLAGSAMFRWAWVESIAAATLFAGFASLSSNHRSLTVLFLLIAPLLPLAAVALAYGPEVDAAYELTVAAPYPQARLLLLRSGAVLLATVPITLIAGLLLPAPDWVPTAWLLPAAALTAIAIAVGTWSETLTGATALAVGWAGFVGWAALNNELQGAFAAPTQFVSLGLLTVAVVVIGYRLTRMDAGWRHRPHWEGTPS
jgi:hypothetical protein